MALSQYQKRVLKDLTNKRTKITPEIGVKLLENSFSTTELENLKTHLQGTRDVHFQTTNAQYVYPARASFSDKLGPNVTHSWGYAKPVNKPKLRSSNPTWKEFEKEAKKRFKTNFNADVTLTLIIKFENNYVPRIPGQNPPPRTVVPTESLIQITGTMSPLLDDIVKKKAEAKSWLRALRRDKAELDKTIKELEQVVPNDEE